jgi:hypothetical protein
MANPIRFKDLSQIVVHRDVAEDGTVRVWSEWVGDTNFAMFSHELLLDLRRGMPCGEGTQFSLQQFRLTIVQDSFYGMVVGLQRVYPVARVMIPKTDVRKDHVAPSPAWGRDASGKLFIRCACGVCMSIDHEVDVTGWVHPALHHDKEYGGCGWHEWGILVGYNDEAEQTAADEGQKASAPGTEDSAT